MYNPVDDMELDRLSKEAAGKYDAPGNTNWQTMQAELDKVLPVEKQKRKTFFFWWLLPALLLGGTALWWLQNKDSGAATEKNIPASISNKTDNNSHSKTPVSNKNTIAAPQENTAEKTIAPKVEATNQPSVTKPVPLTKRLPVQKSVKDISVTGNSLMPIKATGKNEPLLPSSIIKTLTVTPETARSNEQRVIDKPSVLNSKNNIDPTKEILNKINSENPPVTDRVVAKDTNSTLPEVAANSTNNPTLSKTIQPFILKGKGWSFSLLAGVDKSTVKFKYGSGPGINIGVLAGYYFTNTWSVHTGAIYTQKNYKLAGEDFTAPKGSWISYYKIENVEGYCRMWEVPVLIRYTVNNTAKKSFFVSTGLSSYFMTRENYTYSFYNNGLPTTRAASYQSTDTRILSIAHLSLGFENRISKNLSLQIEPYAKIPLSGIGLGNIKLSSFGINFSVQSRKASKK